ncbi:saccharopine dehydrogenase NADP-binding domain-containing protein [Janthinobacterium sp. NFX145]|uniref:saccharopine dehydrogenase NADP-binding domain-containing protein n=1 Tax=Janthinobacterium sp. NFX145 TaxID=3415602 RepID=UPI003CC632C7
MNTPEQAARVVVLGGAGRVGREAVRYLMRHTSCDVQLASRSQPALAFEWFGSQRQRLSWAAVDAFDEAALTALLRGAALVISCIGPSGLVGVRVANACRAAGAPLIDAGGYDPLLAALELAQQRQPAQVPAIISVGLLPGLSGLFPRYVLERTARGRTALKLETYCIGRDAWTYNSAWDIVYSLGDFGQDRGFPVIRDGQHCNVGFRAATRKADFPAPVGRVTTMLVPAEELARLARQTGIAEARAYGSNVGPRAAMVCVLAKVLGMYRTPAKVARAAGWLVAASRRDMRKLAPVYGLKVDIAYADGEAASATMMIADTYQATGVTIGIAARCLLEGPAIAPGVQLLHEAVDARRAMALLEEEGLVVVTGSGVADGATLQEKAA